MIKTPQNHPTYPPHAFSVLEKLRLWAEESLSICVLYVICLFHLIAILQGNSMKLGVQCISE